MGNEKRGRPPKPLDELQTETIRFKATKKDKAAIEKSAKERGLTVSDYMRLLYVGDNGKGTAQNNP